MATKTYEILTHQLGNVRVTFTEGDNGQAEVLEENHYYPFGLRMSGQHFSNTDLINKYLYNAKELQDQTGYYDYGFRQMDPALGRWHVPDALAEWAFSNSPYAYVKNDPLNRIDVLGLADSYVIPGGAGPAIPPAPDDPFDIANWDPYGYGSADISWPGMGGGGPNMNWRMRGAAGGSGSEDAYNSNNNGYIHNPVGRLTNKESNDFDPFWGMIIEGDDEFKTNVYSALEKINATGLGNHMLRTLRSVNPHYALTIRPSRGLSEKIKYGGNGFNYKEGKFMGTIFFSGPSTMVSFTEAYNSFFTNLGHELWHAYQYNMSKGLYIRQTQRLIERGAVRFENYLTAVYGLNNVRTGYMGHTFFEDKRPEFFNVANESFGNMTWTVGNYLGYRIGNPNYNFALFPLF